MTNPVPSALALTTIPDSSLVTAAPHRNNYSAVQTAVNALIVALSGGTAGQYLKAVDGTDVVWGNAADKDSGSTQIFAGSLSSLHGSGAVGGDGTHPGWLLQESGTSGIFQSVSAVGSNIFLTSTVAGNTTGYLFTITAAGTQSWAPTNGAGDTTLARSAPGQLAIGGTAGRGNIVGGGYSNNAGGPATLTPDAAALFNRWNLINASGTFTIAAPANPPGAGQSGLLIICIHNASGGAVTLAWNAIYAAAPATPPTNGNGLLALFAWNPGTSKWDLLGLNSPFVD